MEYTYIKIMGICSICVLVTMIYLSSRDPMLIRKNTYIHETMRIQSFVNQSINRLPLCDNILTNMTNGKWIKRIELLNNKTERQDLVLREQELDRILAEYRINRGIHTRLWRDDNKCGFKNVQSKPKGHEWGGPVGAWCDAKSLKPCCDDKWEGVCGNVCDCENCIDMRKIHHAEVSEWVPLDGRCRPRNFTSFQACQVVKNIKEVRFIGDSFVRKMLRGLVILLRSDPEYGALIKQYDKRKRQFCTGFNQFFWKDCNLPSGNWQSLLLNDSSFCGRHSPKITYNAFYNINSAGHFLNIVKTLAGKNNTYIFLGVGFHDKCSAPPIKKQFLEPSLKYLKKFHTNLNLSSTWPHIVFLYPDNSGLMHSLKYADKNGKARCQIFADEMKTYCEKNNIPVLNFLKLTSGVHSYDGAHHGMGVNIMKAQLMLNYLDSFND